MSADRLEPISGEAWLKSLGREDRDPRIRVEQRPTYRVWIGHPDKPPAPAELATAYRPVYKKPLDSLMERFADIMRNSTPALEKTMRDLNRIGAMVVNERHQDPRVQYRNYLKGPFV